jgi:hypothetical protein
MDVATLCAYVEDSASGYFIYVDYTLGVALGVVLAVASNLGPQPMRLLGLVDARLL